MRQYLYSRLASSLRHLATQAEVLPEKGIYWLLKPHARTAMLLLSAMLSAAVMTSAFLPSSLIIFTSILYLLNSAAIMLLFRGERLHVRFARWNVLMYLPLSFLLVGVVIHDISRILSIVLVAAAMTVGFFNLPSRARPQTDESGNPMTLRVTAVYAFAPNRILQRAPYARRKALATRRLPESHSSGAAAESAEPGEPTKRLLPAKNVTFSTRNKQGSLMVLNAIEDERGFRFTSSEFWADPKPNDTAGGK